MYQRNWPPESARAASSLYSSGMDVAAMLTVLAEVRELLAQPDNDYSWSSFLDAGAALEEIDAIVAEIRSTGHAPLMLRVLFAPTGPIQEVAVSSGWGDTFLVVADRFDDAWASDQ